MNPGKPDWPAAFLLGLVISGSVTRAAKAAGVSRAVVYRRRDTDPQFAAEWERLAARPRRKWEGLFLMAYADVPTFTNGCEAAQVTWRVAKAWQKKSAGFRARLAFAEELANERLFEAARHRAAENPRLARKLGKYL